MTINDILNLLSQDELKKALKEISRFFSPNDELIIFEAQLSFLDKQERKGLITLESLIFERNKIRSGIIDFILSNELKTNKENVTLPNDDSQVKNEYVNDFEDENKSISKNIILYKSIIEGKQFSDENYADYIKYKIIKQVKNINDFYANKSFTMLILDFLIEIKENELCEHILKSALNYVENKKDREEYLSFLSLTYWRRKNISDCEKVVNEILELNPTNISALRNKLALLEHQNKQMEYESVLNNLKNIINGQGAS